MPCVCLGWLPSQQINNINGFFRKARLIGLCSSIHDYVMYQMISEWSTVDYLIAYKVLPTASHICFHQKSPTLAYVLGDIVMHSPHAQITFTLFYSAMSILFSLVTE